jgi:hypothetical protein
VSSQRVTPTAVLPRHSGGRPDQRQPCQSLIHNRLNKSHELSYVKI